MARGFDKDRTISLTVVKSEKILFDLDNECWKYYQSKEITNRSLGVSRSTF